MLWADYEVGLMPGEEEHSHKVRIVVSKQFNADYFVIRSIETREGYFMENKLCEEFSLWMDFKSKWESPNKW